MARESTSVKVNTQQAKPVIITGMAKPVALPINDANMLRIIRELAQDTVNVFFEPHAKKRMKQRGITTTQVYACLRKGVIDEPAHENIRGNWKCTLRHQHAGDLVRLAAAIEKDESGDWIAVVTVF
jgi:hypothetical protein